MKISFVCRRWWFAIAGVAFQCLIFHSAAGAPGRVEAGLEMAVDWKWSVVPADDPEWGVPLPDPLAARAPSQMARRHGLGGFRLTNWDIARAVRLIPAGTALEWRGK
jgi:hypothetical protein